MKFAAPAAFVALAAGASAANITINTPSGALAAYQCEAYQVTWTGGTAPYEIRLLDSSQTYVEELGSDVESSPLVWTVNEASGSEYILTISDAEGNTATTGVFTIQSSSDSSCVSAALSVSAASATGSATATAGSSGSTTTKTGTASASASASTSSSTTTSGASRNVAVAAGVFAPLAALFALVA